MGGVRPPLYFISFGIAATEQKASHHITRKIQYHILGCVICSSQDQDTLPLWFSSSALTANVAIKTCLRQLSKRAFALMSARFARTAPKRLSPMSVLIAAEVLCRDLSGHQRNGARAFF